MQVRVADAEGLAPKLYLILEATYGLTTIASGLGRELLLPISVPVLRRCDLSGGLGTVCQSDAELASLASLLFSAVMLGPISHTRDSYFTLLGSIFAPRCSGGLHLAGRPSVAFSAT